MLDRRSLLIAGTSSLASIMLPRVPGSEKCLPAAVRAHRGYADEEDPSRSRCSARTMFGVVVVDVANKNTPITGAQVTLASRYAAGKAARHLPMTKARPSLRSRRFRKSWTRRRSTYDFNGGISISMAGYRDVEIPLARVQGGTAITAPTRPLSDGEPYFRQLTFDEWDIQYADATFMAMPADEAANDQPTRTLFTVRAHLPRRAGEATLHINKVMPAAGSSSKLVTQIGQVKGQRIGREIIWRRSRSKTSSSMRRQAFWKKDASCALSSTTGAKPTRSPPPWPLLPRRRQGGIRIDHYRPHHHGPEDHSV